MPSAAEVNVLVKAKDEASKVLEDIKGKFKEAGKEVDSLKDKASSMGSALKTALGVAAGFVIGTAITKIGPYLWDAAKAAAEDAASVGRLNTAIGNLNTTSVANIDTVNKRISANQKLAYSDDETRNSLTILVNETGNLDEALKRQTLAMDLARGANIPLATASKLLGKVTEDNVNVLAKYGIAADKGMTETELFARVYERFHGQAQTFADSTAGKMARLQDAMGELKEKIGGVVLPIMTALVDIALNKVVPALEKIVNFIETQVRGAFDRLKPLIDPLIERLDDIANKLIDVGKNAEELAVGLGKTAEGAAKSKAGIAVLGITLTAGLLPVIINTVAAFATMAGGIAATSTAALAAAAPFVLGAIAIVGLGIALYEAYLHIQPFHDAVDSLWDSLGRLWESVGSLAHLFELGFNGGRIAGEFNILQTAAFTLGQVLSQTVIPFIKDVADGFRLMMLIFEGGKVAGQFGEVQTAFINVATAIKTEWENNIRPAIIAFADIAVITFKSVYDTIANLVNFIVDNWPTIGPILQAGIDIAINAITGFIQVVHGIIEVVSGVIQFVDDIIHGRWAQAWEDLKLIAAGIIDIFLGIVRTYFGDIADTIETFVRNAYNSVEHWFNAALDTAKSVWASISGAVETARAAISSAILTITEAIQWVIDKFNEALDILSSPLSIHIDLPSLGPIDSLIGKLREAASISLPHLASGTSNFRGGLALVGEQGPELAYLPRGTNVVPAGQTKSLLNNATGGGSLSVNIQGDVNISNPNSDMGAIGTMAWTLDRAARTRGVIS